VQSQFEEDNQTALSIIFALSSYQCSTLNQTSAVSAVVTVSFAGVDSLLCFFVSEPLLAEALRLGGIFVALSVASSCMVTERRPCESKRSQKEDETLGLCLIRSVCFGRLCVGHPQEI